MPMEIQHKFVVFTNFDESFWESSFVQNCITNMINKYHEKVKQKKFAQHNVTFSSSNHIGHQIFHCHNINLIVIEPGIVVTLMKEIKAHDYLEKP
jgi:hypothetical protein